MPIYSEHHKVVQAALCFLYFSLSSVFTCEGMVIDQQCPSISPAKAKTRVQRNHVGTTSRCHQGLLTWESGLPLLLWAFQKYVSVAGATVPVGYLWVKREQKRTEEMSNLLGSNHPQQRLEEFRGKPFFFPGQWSSASTHRSGLGRNIISVTQGQLQGLNSGTWSQQRLHEQPTLGFRMICCRCPAFSFSTYPPPPLLLTVCDIKIHGD